jgi:hypothetical protein
LCELLTRARFAHNRKAEMFLLAQIRDAGTTGRACLAELSR